ncbi:MAG TPA: DNA/RNA helicase domain-containing protein [Parasegetibacter sp.]
MELYAWEIQINLLKEVLKSYVGYLFFEFSIPRMGKRADCILIIKHVVFVIEFKVGEKQFISADSDQVWDYALDLKNFHKPSHDVLMVPILVATEGNSLPPEIRTSSHNDKLVYPIKANRRNLGIAIQEVFNHFLSGALINVEDFLRGSYSPTPTIVEAAIGLFNSHSVAEITRSDADAAHLANTSEYISETIEYAKKNNKKVVCFVTGVPGAGKTLVGLKVAIDHLDEERGSTSIFLSGNKPLVDVLQEALARDRIIKKKQKAEK